MFTSDKLASDSTIDVSEGWEMLRLGEKKGLGIIYNAYVQDMYRVGMLIIPNSSYVQDCIHEVFESLWKYHAGLKVTDNVKLYLLRSISNRIHRDLAENHGKLHSSHVEDLDGTFSINSHESDLVRDQGNEELRKRLFYAYDKLPPRQKEVIHYLFYESLSYEETSTVMNLHLKSVYNLACKAIANLRKSMILFLFFYTF